MINIGSILTINKIEYVVASACEMDNNQYLYLAKLDDPSNTVICSANDNVVNVIYDENLLLELENRFLKNFNYYY